MAPTTTTDSVGSLRERRRARGLTQVDVARLAGCSVSYVGQLEAGFIPRRSTVVQRVLAVLLDADASPHDAA